jgi:hypothetical protein
MRSAAAKLFAAAYALFASRPALGHPPWAERKMNAS